MNQSGGSRGARPRTIVRHPCSFPVLGDEAVRWRPGRVRWWGRRARSSPARGADHGDPDTGHHVVRWSHVRAALVLMHGADRRPPCVTPASTGDVAGQGIPARHHTRHTHSSAADSARCGHADLPLSGHAARGPQGTTGRMPACANETPRSLTNFVVSSHGRWAHRLVLGGQSRPCRRSSRTPCWTTST
jgi:hypothetical protein